MPGPALHHMICDRLRFDLMSSTGLGNTLPASRYNAIDAQLANPGSLPYLFLGCQGPDFLFFNTKDMPGPIHDLVTAYFDVYDWIKNFLRDLKALVPQPVLDALSALNEAANEVVTSSSTLTELQQLFGNMKAVVTALTSTLLEAVKKFISDFSLFDIISHPYRDGVPKNEPWWWFDAMHYRHTGKFARRLLEKTKPGTQLHLYAIGYLTHVTADTVGHPYVNAISGGPYRSHAQRHKASENYQDVLNFLVRARHGLESTPKFMHSTTSTIGGRSTLKTKYLIPSRSYPTTLPISSSPPFKKSTTKTPPPPARTTANP